jgi:hypothetical protein
MFSKRLGSVSRKHIMESTRSLRGSLPTTTTVIDLPGSGTLTIVVLPTANRGK